MLVMETAWWGLATALHAQQLVLDLTPASWPCWPWWPRWPLRCTCGVGGRWPWTGHRRTVAEICGKSERAPQRLADCLQGASPGLTTPRARNILFHLRRGASREADSALTAKTCFRKHQSISGKFNFRMPSLTCSPNDLVRLAIPHLGMTQKGRESLHRVQTWLPIPLPRDWPERRLESCRRPRRKARFFSYRFRLLLTEERDSLLQQKIS